MFSYKKKISIMDDKTIEKRRIDLLDKLYAEVHPVTILDDLDIDRDVVFMMGETAASAIRAGLADPGRRKFESTALAKVKLAAQTADGDNYVFLIERFQFENVGNADGVLSVARDWLNLGEIEVHSHVYSRPEYLGQVDVGDLIAALEGPAWVHPHLEQASPAQRVIGILSVHHDGLARLQFYSHDLRGKLDAWNNYGLKKFGLPISILDAF
jgi:hypothetical protein